jgi:zinc protease
MNSLIKLNKHPFSLITRVGIVLASAALLSVFFCSHGFGGDDKTEKQFTLDNGLKVFLYERHNQPLVNIVAAVNAGSKDETDETSGLVHLLEHYILFRGTELRSGSEVARDVRRHGGYFNAHTGQDLAIFEIVLPSEFSDFGLNNQREILFNLEFNPAEITAEKEVILEEVSQIKDDPFAYASILFYQNLFSGHPYGRPVIGRPEVIRSLSADQLRQFYQAHFVPGNAALAVVGDFSLKDMEEKVRACFGTVPARSFAPAKFRLVSPPPKKVDIEVELDVKEAYLVIGTLAPDVNSSDQYAADILTEILGRGISPILYQPLKSERDLVNTVNMAYIALKYGGAFEILLTLDPRRLAAAKNQALQYLKQRARNENYARSDIYGPESQSAFDFLESAKNRITFGLQQAQENGLSLATSLAMSLLLFESDNPPNFLEKIKGVSSSDLRKAAGKYFSRSEYVLIAIVPRKK